MADDRGILYMVRQDLKKQLEILKEAGVAENSDTITKLFRIYLKYNIDQHLSFETVEECASFAVTMLNSQCNDNDPREQRQKVKEYLGGCFYGKCLVDDNTHNTIVKCGKTLRSGTMRFNGNTEQCDALPDAATCNSNNKCEWKDGACIRKQIYPMFSRLPPF